MKKTVTVVILAMCILLNCFPSFAAAQSGSRAMADVQESFRESIFLTDMGLSADQQKCLWEHAADHGWSYKGTMEIYVLYVATSFFESGFKSHVKHYNPKNDTWDYGPMQVNSSNVPKLKKAGIIERTEDLMDPIKGLDAGCWMMDRCIEKYGITENTYFHYNAGLNARGRSNPNSRDMWKEFGKFFKVLTGRYQDEWME